MRLYLDEDIASPLLARVLRNAAHDVQVPGDVGLIGRSDAVQLTHAIREDRAVLTRNYCDFEDLHNLLEQGQGHHAGILVVRRDDNARRNMSPRDIARALRNLEAAGLPIADHYIILNAWQ
jgi:predicted nuclease of predicted toxin-antitoxin system